MARMTDERNTWVQISAGIGEYRFQIVLGLSWMELTFLVTICMTLCFGFVTEIVMKTHQCFVIIMKLILLICGTMLS